MSDDIWKRDEADSPCVKVCVIEPASGLCLGCHRSLDEIAAWPRLAPVERKAILAALPDRAARPARRKGGRRARLEGRG